MPAALGEEYHIVTKHITTATVLGDYIYIDGGEVSQKGRNSRGSDPSR